MRAAGERCLRELSALGVGFVRKAHAPGQITTPITVPSMRFGGLAVRQVYAKGPPVMDCHMALALALYGGAIAEQGVVELVVAGFYQNRRARLRGRSLPILSRHALGLAVDIRAIVMVTGERLTVSDHYRDVRMARFERLLRERGQLRAVVTPGNDAAHRSHFHISALMTVDGYPRDEPIEVAALLGQLHRPKSSRRSGASPR